MAISQVTQSCYATTYSHASAMGDCLLLGLSQTTWLRARLPLESQLTRNNLAVFRFSRYSLCTDPQRTPLPTIPLSLCDVTGVVTLTWSLLCHNVGLFLLNYSGFRRIWYIAPSLRLFVPSSLETYCNFLLQVGAGKAFESGRGSCSSGSQALCSFSFALVVADSFTVSYYFLSNTDGHSFFDTWRKTRLLAWRPLDLWPVSRPLSHFPCFADVAAVSGSFSYAIAAFRLSPTSLLEGPSFRDSE
jgi:hypothetical protein